MATLLLFIIFIDFIGLGIPDSLFGPAWPAIYSEMSLPVSLGSIVSLINTGGTVISSLMSDRITLKLGSGKTTFISIFMTAAALLGFSLSTKFWMLCLFAIPFGLGAGSVDAALNNYVALHYKASHMNFLHCFYGIGVTLSPFVLTLTLGDGQWRLGYRVVFFVQLAISILLSGVPCFSSLTGSGVGSGAGSCLGVLSMLRPIIFSKQSLQ